VHPSFDYLVGAAEHRDREAQAERVPQTRLESNIKKATTPINIAKQQILQFKKKHRPIRTATISAELSSVVTAATSLGFLDGLAYFCTYG